MRTKNKSETKCAREVARTFIMQEYHAGARDTLISMSKARDVFV